MSAHWLKFSWNLDELPAKREEVRAPLVHRPATREEIDFVLKVTASAFSMDTGFADIHKTITARLQEKITEVFAEKDPTCVVLQYGNRIIGSSVLAVNDEENNLITGPCILHEYRSRGFGTSLLHASLELLRTAGLHRASGIVREKTAAARYLYPKFGGVSSVWTPDFIATPKLAA